MKKKLDELKKIIVDTIEEKIGVSCYIDITHYINDKKYTCGITIIVLNITFNKQKYPQEFKIRVNDQFEKILKDISAKLKNVEIILNKILWR